MNSSGHRLIDRKHWKATELGEAAYLAYHRERSYRAKRQLATSTKAQRAEANGRPFVIVPPDEVPEWESLSSRERANWTHAALQVAKLLEFGIDPESPPSRDSGQEKKT